MNSKVENVEKNKVKLEIAITPEEFETGLQRSFNKNKNRFNIPGFRKGKAPRKVVETAYGVEVLYEDAVNFLVPEYYDKAVEENQLEPVAQPEFDIVELEKGKDFVFTATVDVKPEVVLGDYKGLTVKKVTYELDEKEVDERIEMVREQSARILTADRPAQNGDIVLIDFEGFIDGKAFQNGKAEDFDLELGSGQLIPGFEEQVVGMSKEEDKDVVVTFPEDYINEDLAGKEATFKVHLKEVKEKELPEVDDEFVQEVTTDLNTVEEYKDSIRKELEEANRSKGERETKDNLVQMVVDNAEVELPDSMVELEADAMFKDFEQSLKYRGLELEQYFRFNKTSKEEMMENFKEEARKNIKTRLTVEQIGKTENIEVTEEEMQTELKKIAEAYERDIAEVEKLYNGSLRDNLRQNLLWDKTIQFIVDNNTEEE